MSCNKHLDVLALLDRRLSDRAVSEVEQHLRTCAQCSAFYQEQLDLNELLESVEIHPIEVPGNLWFKIEAGIQNPANGSRHESILDRIFELFRIPQLGYGLAAGVLMAVTAVVTLQTQNATLDDSATLAELEAFSVEIPAGGNPFDRAAIDTNPFFQIQEEGGSNPFRIGGVER